MNKAETLASWLNKSITPMHRDAGKELLAQSAMIKELYEALLNLTGQVVQAKEGFGLYVSSPSMDKALLQAQTTLEKVKDLL